MIYAIVTTMSVTATAILVNETSILETCSSNASNFRAERNERS